VPGLYAAGDAATRELICGGFTGGGSHNSAWAMSSGTWSGRAAAGHAHSLGSRATSRPVRGAGGAGLRPTGAPGGLTADDVITTVQREVLPYEKNLLRHGDRLTPALAVLDGTWAELRRGLRSEGGDVVRARSAAAMTAHARWMYNAALIRTETRGMHKRSDFPAQDPAQHHRLLAGGLDEVWIVPETATAVAVAS
jgi:succinate dehydrogenase/fumarate reductase flavoprotein subunit